MIPSSFVATLLVDGVERNITYTMMPRHPVYLSIRTDGKDGTGKESDPFNASTPKRFDDLHRAFPEFSIINYLDGEFQTTGSRSYNEESGWYVKEGWQCYGRGGERTKVKRIAFPASATGNGHGVFEDSMYGHGDITIADLTIDENWAGLGADPNNASFSVGLHGNNNRILRVKSINGYGSRTPNKIEAFPISCRPTNDGNKWAQCFNCLIEGCEVASFLGDYSIAICMLDGVQGIIRNCVVNNFIGTAPFGIGNGVILDGNRMTGCRGAFYMDTGESLNSIIRNNIALDASGILIHATPSMGKAVVNKLLIEDNVLEVNGSVEPAIGVALSAKPGTGRIADVTIRGNRFIRKSDGPITDIVAISAAHVEGLLIENNVVDEGMRSQAQWPEYPSTGLVMRGNRTPAWAVPIGLGDTVG